MSDINTTLRGNKKEAENPKNPSVIVSKILTGFVFSLIMVALFFFSSWQLALITSSANCIKDSVKHCHYPTDETAPPYANSLKESQWKSGWPYEVKDPFISFGFDSWLSASQISSWSTPRKIIQRFFKFLNTIMTTGPAVKKWIAKFVITLSLPVILLIMYGMSHIIIFFTTLWGGFFQYIFSLNLFSFGWGFFWTWVLIIFNLIVQPIELFLSFFIIPFREHDVTIGTFIGNVLKQNRWYPAIIFGSMAIFNVLNIILVTGPLIIK